MPMPADTRGHAMAQSDTMGMDSGGGGYALRPASQLLPEPVPLPMGLALHELELEVAARSPTAAQRQVYSAVGMPTVSPNAARNVAGSPEREAAWARAEAEATALAEACRLQAAAERSSRIEGHATERETERDTETASFDRSPMLRLQPQYTADSVQTGLAAADAAVARARLVASQVEASRVCGVHWHVRPGSPGGVSGSSTPPTLSLSTRRSPRQLQEQRFTNAGLPLAGTSASNSATAEMLARLTEQQARVHAHQQQEQAASDFW